MATASCVLSEEKFLCPVCLDVFTDPVSTPCGHNFCRLCIHKYWDTSEICWCPFCKRIFSPRPELQVNTVMSELTAEFKAKVQPRDSTPDPERPQAMDVFCDICSELKEKAIKSCLVCLVSLCEVHVEPHQRVASLRTHTLLDPVSGLGDRMCKMHNKVTELYCRTEQACVCTLCFKTGHRGHNVVSLEEEYEAAIAKKDEAMARIQKTIQSRLEKIAEIESVADEAEKEKGASVQVFTDLIDCIRRQQAELVDAIEERFSAMRQKAGGFLTELRMEIAELESKSSRLERLSHSEDHQLFLQIFPTLCSPSKRDWSRVSVRSDLSFETVKGAVTLLKQRFEEVVEELPEVRLKRMIAHAVDLTLDPDTAYCSLVISQDGKQVINGDTQQNLPNNPETSEMFPEVLTKEGFTAGKFYYEVQVKDNTYWILGVVRESFDRKNQFLSVKNGYWTITCDEGSIYGPSSKPVRRLGKEKLQKVGIFVDYDKGVVSFYDISSKSRIYSFTGCRFTEKLYPYFCLEDRLDGTNATPLIITPVSQTQ